MFKFKIQSLIIVLSSLSCGKNPFEVEELMPAASTVASAYSLLDLKLVSMPDAHPETERILAMDLKGFLKNPFGITSSITFPDGQVFYLSYLSILKILSYRI